jgi:DNA-binding NarL/FixJ family response regulator
MPEEKIRFIIADDHKLFREGLRLVLSDDPHLELMGEAANGAELLELIKFEQPEVILLDLTMPGMAGKQAMKEIKEKYPQIKILILTMSDDKHMVLHLLKEGANGYLLKNADSKEIKLALRACVEEGSYYNKYVTDLVVGALGKEEKPEKANGGIVLNERERQVLELICEGLTAAEIGKQIFLSPRTVEGIRASLLEKTGAANTAKLVSFAIKNGMVS